MLRFTHFCNYLSHFVLKIANIKIPQLLRIGYEYLHIHSRSSAILRAVRSYCACPISHYFSYLLSHFLSTRVSYFNYFYFLNSIYLYWRQFLLSYSYLYWRPLRTSYSINFSYLYWRPLFMMPGASLLETTINPLDYSVCTFNKTDIPG